jgi:hypothetical protein
MILEVAILTVALCLASIINFFMVPAISRSIVENKEQNDEEVVAEFPYNRMIVLNAITWLGLSLCLSFLGVLVWKSMSSMEMLGIGAAVQYFLSRAFRGRVLIFPVFLGFATLTFVVLGSLIAEKPYNIPINLDTSVKMSLIAPNHKILKNNRGTGQIPMREVKVFQLTNLIMIVVSVCMPIVLAVSL